MVCHSNSLLNLYVWAYLSFTCIFTSFVQGEKFADTKKRIQARIGVSDKDFAKYRFALIQVATFKQPSYIEDGQYLSLLYNIHRLTSLQKIQFSTTSSYQTMP